MSIIDSFDRSTLDRLRTAQGRAEWVEEQADLIAAQMIAAMGTIVRAALTEFYATLPTVTASGDFTTLDVIPTQWSRAVADIMPSIEGMYLGGSLNAFTIAADRVGSLPDAFTASWVKVTNTDAANYIAGATNNIVNAGEDIWRSVRVDVAKSVAQGVPTEKLKEQIEKTTGYSEFRADTIARTESHRAFQTGTYQANQSLGKYGPTYKEWLATGDSRTRQSHLDAMALGPIPYDQPFIVGEDELMFPGDDTGSPGEVINCRCVLLDYFPGDEASDGSIIPGEDFAESDEFAEIEAAETEAEPVFTADEQRILEAAESAGVSADEVRGAEPYASTLLDRVRADTALQSQALASGSDLLPVSRALARGDMPSTADLATLGNVRSLAPTIAAEGYDLPTLLTGSREQVAAHIAQVERVKVSRDALAVLADSVNPVYGAAPFAMSFAAWDAEVQNLLHQRRSNGEWTPEQTARYSELVPERVDMVADTWQETYALTVQTARLAGLEVPSHARIPWQD